MLSILCSQFRAADVAYSKGRKTESDFKQSLAAITNTVVTLTSASLSRLDADLANMEGQLVTYDSIAGPSLTDLQKTCAS